jgi:hypothetical protein
MIILTLKMDMLFLDSLTRFITQKVRDGQVIFRTFVAFLRGNFFQCRVFAMKSAQNLKCFWRSSHSYFVLALFCSLHCQQPF